MDKKHKFNKKLVMYFKDTIHCHSWWIIPSRSHGHVLHLSSNKPDMLSKRSWPRQPLMSTEKPIHLYARIFSPVIALPGALSYTHRKGLELFSSIWRSGVTWIQRFQLEKWKILEPYQDRQQKERLCRNWEDHQAIMNVVLIYCLVMRKGFICWVQSIKLVEVFLVP